MGTMMELISLSVVLLIGSAVQAQKLGSVRGVAVDHYNEVLRKLQLLDTGAVDDGSPTKLCKESTISVEKTVGATPFPEDSIEVVSVKTTTEPRTVTVDLKQTWSDNAVGSIFTYYSKSAFDTKCYESTDVPEGIFDTITIKCMSINPVALLEICVADSFANGVLVPKQDTAEIPECCYPELPPLTGSACYVVLVSCDPCETTKTPEPTAAPTEDPTKAPTMDPTAAPTEDPTKAPTMDPTAAPTKDPTKAPTMDPTAAPTEDPTKAPTMDPTAAPTDVPTASPTKSPTAEPTKNPSASPTICDPPEDPVCPETWFSDVTMEPWNGCKEWFFCKKGMRVDEHIYPCGEGLLLDVGKQSCRPESEVDFCPLCTPPTPEPTPEPTATPTKSPTPEPSKPPTAAPTVCVPPELPECEAGKGTMPWNGCKSYYFCRSGGVYPDNSMYPFNVYDCPPGQLFDVAISDCSSSPSVECSSCVGPRNGPGPRNQP